MKISNIYYLSILVLWISACEEPFIPDLADVEPKYIVEAYVEAGQQDRIAPPYALLTYSIPIYSEIDRKTIENQFIRDAQVQMVRGRDTIKLTEFCLSDLPIEIQREILKKLEITTFDSIDIDMCAYIDLTNELNPQEGDEIELSVVIKNDTVRARTTLPFSVPLDSFQFQSAPSPEITDYKQLIGFISDPADQANFYRYKISVNQSRYSPGFISVVDDELFNGLTFDFPLNNTTQFNMDVEFDVDVFGLYRVGDTVSIQWMSIDKAHYDFWSSLEYARTNQGPFSSYTRVKSNIQGGLGVFGGYSTRFYDLRVPSE